MEISQTRKRPRPVVSCLRCREKKLKCDRAAPCQNCIKAGCSAECTYNQHPEPGESLPKPKRLHLHAEESEPVPPGAGIGILEDLQQRVNKLEALLAVQPHAGTFGSTRDAPVQNPWSQPDITSSDTPFLGTLVVKGSRSRYHGQNNRITLLNQFAEAKGFINQCARDPTLRGLAKEVQFLQTKSQSQVNSPESISGLETFPELQSLVSSLPPKAVCDHLLEVYIKNFEKTLRIIHIPSFLQHYETFWARTDTELSFVASFVPSLTVILSIAVVLDPQPCASDYSSSWHYLQQEAVRLVQTWIHKLPRQQRTELATLQLNTLLLLTRQLRLVSVDELWKASGSLVRSAMVMGLHVNLSKSNNMKPFQAECRRRLWLTIVEMDLQVSIAAGMPVLTPELDFGPLMPANLNDADFDESTTEMPCSRPPSETTDTSALITLAKSLSQRIRTMNLVQNTNSTEDLKERVKQGQKLEQCLQEVPFSLKPDNQSENTNPALILSRVLLDIYIRRPLLCLYRPVITSDSRGDPSFLEVQRACLESSLAILSYQDYFDPSATDLDMDNSPAYWNVFQTFCHNDILWAALGVCEHMKLSNHQSTAPSPASDLSSKVFPQYGLSYTKAGLTRLIESTLDSLTRRIGEKGSNVKDVVLLAVVLQSVRARGPTEQKERWMFQGAKKALSACRQHLLAAAAERSFPFSLDELSQIPNDTMPPPLTQLTSPVSQLPEFLQQSSTLADEFNNFEGDLFAFDDGAFMWNI
ncbi:uncharacterized protein N7459_002651 [Penicillium hispanicum]|uniref:uncharacterized protein n=1 Tax=Penicillium hispanicum TaxID=1080232 RepID=UPI00253F7E3C|nr:uncharacterized protein N7459_002651 [Penicillium hispanicum]KAJ5586886.1 hypothetical protein N7459_002651 [Penicillium hispanicum]